MDSRNFSRRGLFVRGAGLLPALGLLPLAARGAAAAACADPTEGLRMPLHYMEASNDPAKTCTSCGFFTPEGENGCGMCKIFNGPTNPKGHCDSWAAKS